MKATATLISAPPAAKDPILRDPCYTGHVSHLFGISGVAKSQGPLKHMISVMASWCLCRIPASPRRPSTSCTPRGCSEPSAPTPTWGTLAVRAPTTQGPAGLRLADQGALMIPACLRTQRPPGPSPQGRGEPQCAGPTLTLNS